MDENVCCAPEQQTKRSKWTTFIHRFKAKFLELQYRFLFKERPKTNSRMHAEREFVALGYDLNDTEEGPNKWIMENVFELLAVFGTQGHSGMSAPYAIKLFEKMASFEPCTPLTGKDNEWDVRDYDSSMAAQNTRCSSVFKDSNGNAYHSDAIIFEEPDGCCFTSYDSRVMITFPYTPFQRYIRVDIDGNVLPNQ